MSRRCSVSRRRGRIRRDDGAGRVDDATTVPIDGATPIEIDLTGQVCSDSIGTYIYSGFGGQVDFIRGAARSNGGLPIVAFTSTTKDDSISRIVPVLSRGDGVPGFDHPSYPDGDPRAGPLFELAAASGAQRLTSMIALRDTMSLVGQRPNVDFALVALAEVQIAVGDMVPAAETLGRVIDGDPDAETPAGQRAQTVAAAALIRPSGVTSRASMASTVATTTACMRPFITQLAKVFMGSFRQPAR